MATKLYPRETTTNGIGSFRDAVITRGASATTGVVNTAASGTNIQWTKTAGGSNLEWISGRAPSGGFTLSGLVTVRLRALESNMNANCGARIRLYKRASGGTETELTGSPWNDGVEFGTTDAAFDWTFTPTSMAFAENDRLVIRFFITNVGTMASGFTCTMGYDGPTDGAAGDTFVQINENVTFKAEPTFQPEQEAFRFYENGTESGSVALAAQDTNVNVNANIGNQQYQLRVRIQERAGAAGLSTDDYKIQYSTDSGAYADTSPYIAVSGGDFGGATPGEATTNRLGAGSGSFIAGEVASGLIVDNIQLTANNYTELLFGFRTAHEIDAEGHTVDFRVVVDKGAGYVALDAYDVTPRATFRQSELTLTAFRFYEDGTEGGSVAIAAQDTNITRDTVMSPVFQLRMRMQENNGWPMFNTEYKTQVSKNGGPYQLCQSEAGAFGPYSASLLGHDQASTNRLGAGSGSFVTGPANDSRFDGAGFATLTASNYTEFVIAIMALPGALRAGDTFDFKLINPTNLTYVPITNTVTPRLTVATPTHDQIGYRFYEDGTEGGAEPLAAQNVPASIDVSNADAVFQMRAVLLEKSGIGTDHKGVLLEARKNGGTWYPVTDHSPNVRMAASPVAPSFPPQLPVLLINADGVPDASGNILDATGRHRIAPNGNAQVDTGQVLLSGGAVQFDGTGDYLLLDGSNDFAFGLGDFTIEFFVRFAALGSEPRLYDGRDASTGDGLIWSSSGDAFAWFAAGADRIVGTTARVIDTTYHIAVSRVNGITRLFVNGVQEGVSYVDTTDYTVGVNRPAIGARGTTLTEGFLNGWIDELKVWKGVGRYSANFPVQTVPHALPAASVDSPSLLIHGDGSDASTNINDATGRHAITLNGNAQIDTAQSKFGGASILFDGTGDFIELDGSSDFTFEGDFTVDFWVRFNATGQQYLYDWREFGTSGVAFLLNGSNKFHLFGNASNSEGTTVISTGVWYHVAITRSGSTTRFFIDGTQEGSIGETGIFVAGPSRPTIGLSGSDESGGPLNGWIDELRVIKGLAVWTANFTAPTVAYGVAAKASPAPHFLLQADSVTGPDVRDATGRHSMKISGDAGATAAQSKFGGQSLVLDGSGDYVECDSSSDFAFGTGDFTIDMWVRFSAFNDPGGVQALYDSRPSATQGQYPLIALVEDELWYHADGGSRIATGTNPFTLDTWHHVAVTRSAGRTRLFVDGVQLGSTFEDGYDYSVGPDTRPYIGANTHTLGDYFNGHIDELRVIKGVALWSSNFTPPTEAYRAEPFQKLLLRGEGIDASRKIIDASVYGRNVVTTGSAQIDDAQSKFGGGSLRVSAGAYIQLGDFADFAFGTRDFTIDFWVRFDTIDGTQVIYDSRPGNDGVYVTIYKSGGDHSINLFVSSATRITGTTGVSADTWYHVALARRAGSTRLFLNGTQEGSTYTDANSYLNTVNRPVIGVEGNSLGSSVVDGWLEEFRVLVGVAAWDANFTPPTVPYETAETTLPTASLLLHGDGADASTSILDAMGKQTLVLAGNVQLDTAQSKFGGASILFDGTGDFIELHGAFDLAFGTGDFTIDCWVRLADSTATIIDFGANGPKLYTGAGELRFAFGGGNISAGGNVTTGTWHHLAATRSSGTLRIFLNGVQQDSDADANNYSFTATRPIIGIADNESSDPFNGHLDELRVIKGHAVWTAGFTPPTTQYNAATRYGTSHLRNAFPGLLLHGDGADASTSIVDSWVSGHTPALAGNVQIDTAQSKFGGASILFDGTGDYIDLDGPDFDFGTGDFTIDFWVRATSTANNFILYDGRTTGQSVTVDITIYYDSTSNALILYVNGAARITGTTDLSTDTWYHVALTRRGTSTRLFLNGAQEGSTYTDSNDYNGWPNRPRLGADGNDAGQLFSGWLDEIRILKSIAAWTDAFAPPTVAYADEDEIGLGPSEPGCLIHCDGSDGSTAIYDSGRSKHPIWFDGDEVGLDTAQSRFGGSSALFGNTGGAADQAFINGNADFAFGTGDFTIDLWFRATGGVNKTLFDMTPQGSGSSDYPTIGINGTIGTNATVGGFGVSGSTLINADTWYHVALTRENGTARLFLNGAIEDQQANTINVVNDGTNRPMLANNGSNQTRAFAGWLDEIRVVKGRAAWTAAFAPPSAPYRNFNAGRHRQQIAEPGCLFHFNGADASVNFPDSGGNNHAVTAHGGAQIDTAQSKFGGASILFDGTNDFIELDGSADFAFGKGDFTIDFQLRTPASLTGFMEFFNTESFGASFGGAVVRFYMASGQVKYFTLGNEAIVAQTLSTSTWYHLALTRSGGQTRIFVDGVQGGSTYTDNNDYGISGSRPIIGREGRLEQSYLSGHIDELRVIKGRALWDKNFTPPTAAYPDIPGQRVQYAARFDAGDRTEHLVSLRLIKADVVDNDTIDFRFVKALGGGALAAYSALPRITVDETVGIAAQLTQTLQSATLSATAVAPIAAALAKTLQDFSAAATAVAPIVAQLSQTLGDATTVATAVNTNRAELTQTLADATLAATALVRVAGQLSQTLGNASLSSTAVAPIAAQVTQTLGDATLAATAVAPVAAALSQTLQDFTLAASGSAQSPILAELNQTLQDVSSAATATVLVAAQLNQALADATLAATGVAPIAAQVNQTLADATLLATAALRVSGQVSQTLQDATSAADADVLVRAQLTQTLNNATLVAIGGAGAVAEVNQILQDATLAATAVAPLRAEVNQTLANAALNATAVSPIRGTVAQTLDNATLAAAAVAPVLAQLAQTLQNAALAANAAAPVVAELNQQLADATLAAIGTVEGAGITGQLNQTLQDAVVSAAAVLPVSGQVAATLGNATTVADAAVLIIGVLNQALANATLAAVGSAFVPALQVITLRGTWSRSVELGGTWSTSVELSGDIPG